MKEKQYEILSWNIKFLLILAFFFNRMALSEFKNGSKYMEKKGKMSNKTKNLLLAWIHVHFYD